MKRPSKTPSPLHTRILALADAFARDVLAAMQRASVQEILGEHPRDVRELPVISKMHARRPPKRSKRAARSPAEIARLVERIARAVDATPQGLSAGELREHLALDASAFARPIREAVAAGRIATQGKGRFTVYVSTPAPKQKAKPRRAGGAARARADRALTDEETSTPNDAMPLPRERTEADA